MDILLGAPRQPYATASPVGLADLIAAYPWQTTPLGPASGWPPFLKSTVALLLESALPIVTLWGPQGILIYNDAYAQFAGARHPSLLGAAVLEGWPEVADLNARVLEAGFARKTLSFRDEQLILLRHGFPETIFLDLDYSPIPAADGSVAGVFCVVRETTERVKLERQRAADLVLLNAAEARQACLIELGDNLRRAQTPGEIAAAVADMLGRTLACVRTGYAAIKGQETVIENDWTDGSVASLSGRHAFDALGESYTAHIARGEILAVPDIATHPATAPTMHCWRAIDVVALINVPLLEHDRLVGLIYVHDSRPRAWTAEDLALVKDVADRTWEAIGRARAAEQLRQMNETLEAQVRERTAQRDRMWTLTTDLMMVSNRAGTILSVNPAWTHLLGWREDDLVGRQFYDFMHPDDRIRTRAERQKLEAGLTLHKFENRYLTRDGAAVWLSWSAVPDGELIHSAARDINRRARTGIRAAGR
jgi:PAS domain S-box-containing protein